MTFWFEMIDESSLVINDRRSVLSNADILIRVATSVIEYGLLQATFILASVKYDMMAAQRWILTAFSEYPHRVFTVMFCLIHLKNTSISHRWRYIYIPSMAVQVGYFQGTDFKIVGYKVHNSVIVRVINADKSHVFGIQLA